MNDNCWNTSAYTSGLVNAQIVEVQDEMPTNTRGVDLVTKAPPMSPVQAPVPYSVDVQSVFAVKKRLYSGEAVRHAARLIVVTSVHFRVCGFDPGMF